MFLRIDADDLRYNSSFKKACEALTDDDATTLNRMCTENPSGDQVTGQALLERHAAYKLNWRSEAVISLDDLHWLTTRGFTPKVTMFKTLVPTQAAIPTRVTSVEQVAQTHVHIPGLGLMHIDQVLLEEDCCTDQVQRHLDDGWRILACCYSTGNRRPDYIFGRQGRPK